MKVGGFTPFSSTDLPGKLSAVVFCQGCPLRCRYCHNPHLLPRAADEEIDWHEIRCFLARRRFLLEAVVFSGGEPLLQHDLADAIAAMKELGYVVGLHTSGINTKRLRRIVSLVNWVGLDIKAPHDKYKSVSGSRQAGRRAWDSAAALIESKVDAEFRTTVHPGLTSEGDIMAIASALKELGAKSYTLQRFRTLGCADEQLNRSFASWREFPSRQLQAELRTMFANFTLR